MARWRRTSAPACWRTTPAAKTVVRAPAAATQRRISQGESGRFPAPDSRASIKIAHISISQRPRRRTAGPDPPAAILVTTAGRVSCPPARRPPAAPQWLTGTAPRCHRDDGHDRGVQRADGFAQRFGALAFFEGRQPVVSNLPPGDRSVRPRRSRPRNLGKLARMLAQRPCETGTRIHFTATQRAAVRLRCFSSRRRPARSAAHAPAGGVIRPTICRVRSPTSSR